MLQKCRYFLKMKYMFLVEAHFILDLHVAIKPVHNSLASPCLLHMVCCCVLRSYKHYIMTKRLISTLNVFCPYQLYPEMHAIIMDVLSVLINVTKSPITGKSKHKSPFYYIMVSLCIGFFFPYVRFGVTVLPL